MKSRRMVITILLSGLFIVLSTGGLEADPADTPAASGYVIREGEDWRPIDFHKDIPEHSIIDFSDTLDAPAGKYGAVVIRNGHFEFENRPGLPVRFYGTNLSDSAYHEHEWAERLAKRMAAYGFNIVRIHHHDEPLTLSPSTEINPVRQEQFDYLVAAFKKLGIYITTDLYVSRYLDPGEIPEFPGSIVERSEFKGLVWILDSAYENWKTYSRSFLCHVNPYTGLALKDDPILVCLSMINEDNIDRFCGASDRVRAIYEEKFCEWLNESKRTPADNDERALLFNDFLTEVFRNRLAEMRDFLTELGVKCPLTDHNYLSGSFAARNRVVLDYVDNHCYFGGPYWSARPYWIPAKYNHRSAVPGAYLPDESLMTRIFGKPFTITEFDICRPSPYRKEGALLMSVFGSLQDWDMLCQFAYSHWNPNIYDDNDTTNWFNISTDCVKSLANMLGAQVFLNGRIRPFETAAALVVGDRPGIPSGQYSGGINQIGRAIRCGTLVTDKNVLTDEDIPDDITILLNHGDNFPEYHGWRPVLDIRNRDPEGINEILALHPYGLDEESADKKIIRTSDGRFCLDRQEAVLQVCTETCEAAVIPPEKCVQGHFMTVTNTLGGTAICAAVPRDGAPLALSRRILLFHLTDTQGCEAEFGASDLKEFNDWGHGPFMAAKGAADIIISCGPDAQLYALDTAGERIGEVPISFENGHGKAQLSVFNDFGQCMLYELVLKPLF